MKIRPVGAELFHADGRMDITTLSLFANLPTALKPNSVKSAFLQLNKTDQDKFVTDPFRGIYCAINRVYRTCRAYYQSLQINMVFKTHLKKSLNQILRSVALTAFSCNTL
jgi:hypothetical protein